AGGGPGGDEREPGLEPGARLGWRPGAAGRGRHRPVGADLPRLPEVRLRPAEGGGGRREAGGPCAQTARSRTFSIRRTRSAWVPASGVTLSVVTPDSFSAASRSATWPSEPISEVPASS